MKLIIVDKGVMFMKKNKKLLLGILATISLTSTTTAFAQNVLENDYSTDSWDRFTYNYSFSSGSDYGQSLGKSTSTDVEVMPAIQNVNGSMFVSLNDIITFANNKYEKEYSNIKGAVNMINDGFMSLHMVKSENIQLDRIVITTENNITNVNIEKVDFTSTLRNLFQ